MTRNGRGHARKRKRELEGGESRGGTAAANVLGPRQQQPGEGETETGPRQQRPGEGETETRRTHSDKGTAPDGAPARLTGALAAVATLQIKWLEGHPRPGLCGRSWDLTATRGPRAAKRRAPVQPRCLWRQFYFEIYWYSASTLQERSRPKNGENCAPLPIDARICSMRRFTVH